MSQYNHKTVTVTVTDEVKERLLVLAYRCNTSIDALVGAAIDLFLECEPEVDTELN